MTTKTHIIGLKEFRNKTGKVITAVSRGASFTVLRRSQPVFTISPVDDEEGWETLIDFTKIRKGGVPVDEVVKAMKRHGKTR